MTRALAFILFLSSGLGGCAAITPATINAAATIAVAILQQASKQ